MAEASLSEVRLGRERLYDIDDFHRQIESEPHPDGTEVSKDMPRWKMSDSDLADMFAFLKALPD